MTTLAESMRGLAEDIVSSHQQRRAWLAALKQEVSSMRREMRASSRDRRGWVSSLQDEVAGMLQEFSSDFHQARLAWQEVTGRKAGADSTRLGKRSKPPARRSK